MPNPFAQKKTREQAARAGASAPPGSLYALKSSMDGDAAEKLKSYLRASGHHRTLPAIDENAAAAAASAAASAAGAAAGVAAAAPKERDFAEYAIFEDVSPDRLKQFAAEVEKAKNGLLNEGDFKGKQQKLRGVAAHSTFAGFSAPNEDEQRKIH